MTKRDLEQLLNAWGRWGASTSGSYPRTSAICRIGQPANDQPYGSKEPPDCPPDIGELIGIIDDITADPTQQRAFASLKSKYWRLAPTVVERAQLIGISTSTYHQDCATAFSNLLMYYRGKNRRV